MFCLCENISYSNFITLQYLSKMETIVSNVMTCRIAFFLFKLYFDVNVEYKASKNNYTRLLAV